MHVLHLTRDSELRLLTNGTVELAIPLGNIEEQILDDRLDKSGAQRPSWRLQLRYKNASHVALFSSFSRSGRLDVVMNSLQEVRVIDELLKQWCVESMQRTIEGRPVTAAADSAPIESVHMPRLYKSGKLSTCLDRSWV